VDVAGANHQSAVRNPCISVVAMSRATTSRPWEANAALAQQVLEPTSSSRAPGRRSIASSLERRSSVNVHPVSPRGDRMDLHHAQGSTKRVLGARGNGAAPRAGTVGA
jgi:hypothetical protein